MVNLDRDWLPRLSAKMARQHRRHHIVTDQGEQWPSVTTILNATRSPEQRQALANWRQRVGSEEASRIATTASRRGGGTHRYIQRCLEGDAIACPDIVQPYWQSIQPVLQQLQTVRLVEGYVVHDTLGYAGQVDCIATYQGIPCVCEWKTADRPKGSIDRLYDYPLQLAAYCGAANQTYHDYGLQITHALLVVAIPHHPAELFWFDSAHLVTYWQQWHERVDRYHRLH